MIKITSACNGCGICEALCPAKAVAVREGKAFVDETVCIGCLQCACGCGAGAVETGLPIAGGVYSSPLDKIVKTRRSCRCFAKEAPSSSLDGILAEAVAACPSALNGKTVRIRLIRDKKTISAVSKKVAGLVCFLVFLASLPIVSFFVKAVFKKNYPLMINYGRILSAEEDRVFFNAPCLALVTYKKGAVMGEWDGHIAAHTCVLLLEEMGYSSCYIGVAKPFLALPSLKKMTGIGLDESVAACFVFGKPLYKYHRQFAWGKNDEI